MRNQKISQITEFVKQRRRNLKEHDTMNLDITKDSKI